MNTIPVSETISLKSAGYDEAWLQDQIWENPSCLGLGELETVTKEHKVSSGGRLDILLKHPDTDAMYEVETMLGETDASHIMRTIEYWDLVRRKWPQHEHYGVLVAERITKRFFNVIHILSDAVPLIAIQANIVESTNGRSLHFTKILDAFVEPEIEPPQESGVWDEAYWAAKSQETLDVARYVQESTKDIYVDSKLSFTKNAVMIACGSYNQMGFRPRKGNKVRVGFRYGNKRDEIAELLESEDIQYSEVHSTHFRFFMPVAKFKDKADTFRKIAELNNQWWAS